MNSVALAIKVTADAKAASAGLDGVTAKTSKMGRAGKAAGRLLAGGLLLAAGAAVKATQAAAEDEAAQSRLAGALRNATGARAKDIAGVEDWIAAQGKALGVSDDELRPSLEKLVTATKDIGTAQRAASLAMNISARTGKSLESVSAKLAKAYATGNVGALAAYGVATKNAAGKTRDMDKVMLDLTKTYQGAASDAADTAAGKQKKLQVAMGELQEEIGAKLLPVLLKAAEYGLKVVAWIEKNQTAAAAIIGTFAGLLAIVKLVSLATTIYSTYLKIAAASQAVFNAVMAANPILLIVIAVVALAAAFVIAYKRSETFRNIVNKVASSIAKAFSTAVNFIKNNWKTMLAILAGPIGIAVLLIIKHRDKIQAVIGAAKDWIGEKWKALKDLLSGPVEKAKTLIKGYFDAIGVAMGAAKTLIDTAASGIKGFLEAAFKPIQTAIGWVQSLIDKINSIPKPDLNPLSRSAFGGGGVQQNAGQLGPKGRGSVTFNVNVGSGFVGDERKLAAELKRILGADLRRLA